MSSIHVITDRERLKRIFSTLATDELSVRISGGLEAGLPELQHEVPEALFIQSHLNGLTGELIVRHVANYASPVTKLVLLREGQESCRGISHAIELGVSDEELVAAIQESIDRFVHGKVKKSATPRRKPLTDLEEPEEATESTADIPEPAVIPLPAEESSFQDTLKGYISEMNEPHADIPLKPERRLRRRSEKKLSAKMTTGIVIGLVAAIAAGLLAGKDGSTKKPSAPKQTVTIAKNEPPHQKEELPKSAVARPKDPAPASPAGTPGHAAPAATQTKTPVAPTPPAVKPIAPAAPAQKAATPAMQPSPPPAAPPKVVAKATAPAAQAKPAPAPTAPRTAIPGFVPREKMDKAYSAKNPGWERYLGKNTEFRVYKPAGVVKAVQAIDRKGVGIPQDFLEYALNQMLGSPQLTVQGTEKKGDYNVTRAAAAQGSRVLLYRKGGNKPLKAFVVYFEETGGKKP